MIMNNQYLKSCAVEKEFKAVHFLLYTVVPFDCRPQIISSLANFGSEWGDGRRALNVVQRVL
jgi:hypothetical protein